MSPVRDAPALLHPIVTAPTLETTRIVRRMAGKRTSSRVYRRTGVTWWLRVEDKRMGTEDVDSYYPDSSFHGGGRQLCA
jgi:hypothetical protein